MTVLLEIASKGTSIEENNAQVIYYYYLLLLLLLLLSFHQADQTAAIHSINILRGLIRESKLGEAVVPVIAASLMVALEGFSYKSWPVRLQQLIIVLLHFSIFLCLGS